ncbi:Zinc finger BED domain-containing protein DAYSLEEPER [Holothuria leucospilota]|uniref:Zinc finger BED domain-containing protein DAYSLEEPER n=1 Tax=Holothuria leucospilota TaxID=206669 RepID=A0A9Q1CD41_HOLLE|nr:Zinc finger BED domain-containing protein DAYSLEEPER [Holothuria leucospilota]
MRHVPQVDRQFNKLRVQPFETKTPYYTSSREELNYFGFFVTKTVCHPTKTQKLNTTIGNTIAKDSLPVSFVEGDGFRDLMKAIEPSYTVSSRKTVSTLLLAKFEPNKTNVKTAIEVMASVSLTSDYWTSRASEGYTTVTAHGID